MEIQYEHAFLCTMYLFLGKWLINFLNNLIDTEHSDNPKEHSKMELMGFPDSSVVKNLPAKCSRCEFNPWVGKIPWRRKWQPTPVSLSGKFHGQKSLAGYSPWGRKRAGRDLVTQQQDGVSLSTWNNRLVPNRKRSTYVVTLLI